MRFFDTHCHSRHSVCGQPDVSLDWYRQVAKETAFVITDHSSHIFAPRREHAWWAWLDPAPETFFAQHRDTGYGNLRAYYDKLLPLRSSTLRVGAEVDVLPNGQVVFPGDLLKKLDFVVGAVHGVRGLKDTPGPAYDAEAVAANYKRRVLALLTAGVDSIAHPFTEWDTLKKDTSPLPDLLDWLMDAAKDAGAALEINSHHPFPEMDLLMIRRAATAGVRLSIATDTHARNEFGGFAYHRRILARAGIAESEYGDILVTYP